MTAYKQVLIRCDHAGCPRMVEVAQPQYAKARNEARRTGWRTVPDKSRNGGRDYCPDHVDDTV